MKLTGERVYLRFLEPADADALHSLRLRNADFFQKFSPAHDSDYYTIDSVRSMLNDVEQRRAEGRDYFFGIFLTETGELIGDVNLFHIMRGPLQKCMVGYSLDQRHNGHGYTTEALKLAVRYAFEELKLHRVEAGAMPVNVGSMRVLEKAGFEKEGIERKGVKINGQWQDHQIFSILSDSEV